MIHQNNHCTEFMFLVVMVCVTLFSTIVSHNFQYPFRFQDITVVSWNICRQLQLNFNRQK